MQNQKKFSIRFTVFVSICFFMQIHANAATPKIDLYKGLLTQGGVIRGGQSGSVFTIKDIRKSKSTAKNTERIIFEFGDRFGNKFSGDPAYYNIQYIEKPNQRIVVDLAQTSLGSFEPNLVEQRLKKSGFIQKTSILAESQNNYTSIVLDLKKEVQVKVYNIKGDKNASPKLVMDLQGKAKK